MHDPLSITSGPKLPPVYKGGEPENIKGTLFAAGYAQQSKYMGKGYKGRPVGDTWDDGNPKMQYVFYLVGESGNALRIMAPKTKTESQPYTEFLKFVDKSFSELIGKTFCINCKITYKPGTQDVAFRTWKIAESPVQGEDFYENIKDEWKDLPKGVLDTFYYPGYSPEEIKSNQATVPAAPPEAVVNPQPAAEGNVIDDDIPF